MQSRPVLTDGRTASVQRRHEQCMDRRCWRIVAYPDITGFSSSVRVGGYPPRTQHFATNYSVSASAIWQKPREFLVALPYLWIRSVSEVTLRHTSEGIAISSHARRKNPGSEPISSGNSPPSRWSSLRYPLRRVRFSHRARRQDSPATEWHVAHHSSR
jgi:hypothetical protein